MLDQDMAQEEDEVVAAGFAQRTADILVAFVGLESVMPVGKV
jgi:hypothetical protein